MTKNRIPRDLKALHRQRVSVEQVDLAEDTDGTPSESTVEREMATVVIVPSLLAPGHES